jgi:hypothetical protein
MGFRNGPKETNSFESFGRVAFFDYFCGDILLGYPHLTDTQTKA